MIKRFLLCIVVCVSMTASAQDVITKRDGDEILAKVTDITDIEVKYKKWSNPDGPTYTLKKADVFMIKYQNGDKDVFKDTPAEANAQQPQQNAEPKVTAMKPSETNASVIAKYNAITPAFLKAEKKDKPAKNWIGALGVTPSSVMVSSDLTINIEQEKKSMNKYEREQEGVYTPGFYTDLFECRYMITLTNNSNQMIYVDKTMSFRIDAQGHSACFFNSDVTTVNQSSTSGGSMNLGAVAGAIGVGGVLGTLAGGATVGGSNQNGVSTTKTDDRIVVIPPHGTVTLCKDERVDAGKKKKNLSYSEGMDDLKISGLKYGETKTFTHETVPASYKYIVSFYKGTDTTNSYTQQIEVFPRCVVGIGSDFYNAFTNSKDRIYENFIKKYVSEVSPTTIVVIGREK